jgi:hypothetical protein
MNRQRCMPVRAKACLGLLLLAFTSGVSACDEDGKTVPERCGEPTLPYDIQAGAPADDSAQHPCSTPVGHAVNGGPAATAGTASSGGASGAGGESSGTATAGAGAGGAP